MAQGARVYTWQLSAVVAIAVLLVVVVVAFSPIFRSIGYAERVLIAAVIAAIAAYIITAALAHRCVRDSRAQDATKLPIF